MFFIGLIGFVLFLVFACDMDLGTASLWVAVACIIAVPIDFMQWKRRRR